MQSKPTISPLLLKIVTYSHNFSLGHNGIFFLSSFLLLEKTSCYVTLAGLKFLIILSLASGGIPAVCHHA
jgi:hypothetical protein